MTKSLDLGCGLRPKNPFDADEVFGVDIRDDIPANIRSADLSIEPIPFDDAAFDYVTAHDFLEHVPRVLYAPQRRNGFVELMNEIYRVLKVDGLFLSLTPAFPHAPAFRDPTHVNIITDDTFSLYFDDTNRWAAAYGFKGAFKIYHQEWRGAHLLTVMKKVVLPITEAKPLRNLTEENLQFSTALALKDQGKIAEASKILWDLHINDPANGEPLQALSEIALAAQNYPEALRIIEHAVKIDPLSIPLRVVHGDILFALDNKAAALQSYEKALDIHPNYLPALIKSAITLEYLQRTTDAINRFMHILDLDPKHLVALEHLSQLKHL